MKSTNTLMIMAVISGLLAANTATLSQISTNQPTNPAPTTTHEWSITAQLTRIDNAVQLTDIQKVKLQASLSEIKNSIEVLKGQKMNWKDRLAAAKSIRERMDKKLKDVLTAAQYAKLHSDSQQHSHK